jgi:hypothetical protein
MGPRARRSVVAVIALTTGIAIGATVAPTLATWLDRGGSTMSVTAINQAPPEAVGPVQPGPGGITSFVASPIWSGPNGAPNPEPRNACFQMEIRTVSPVPIPWVVVIETDQPPFNNVAPFVGFVGQFFGVNAAYGFAPASDYATTGRYLMTPTQTSQYASATQGYLAKACAVNVPEPAWQPPGPDTYTQRPLLTLVRNGAQPCVAGTVDGHRPFYVGFTLSFNWKTFLDERLAAGAITQTEHDQWIRNTHWAGGPPGYNPAQGATGTDYLVTLQGYADFSRTVANFAPVTIASCSY